MADSVLSRHLRQMKESRDHLLPQQRPPPPQAPLHPSPLPLQHTSAMMAFADLRAQPPFSTLYTAQPPTAVHPAVPPSHSYIPQQPRSFLIPQNDFPYIPDYGYSPYGPPAPSTRAPDPAPMYPQPNPYNIPPTLATIPSTLAPSYAPLQPFVPTSFPQPPLDTTAYPTLHASQPAPYFHLGGERALPPRHDSSSLMSMLDGASGHSLSTSTSASSLGGGRGALPSGVDLGTWMLDVAHPTMNLLHRSPPLDDPSPVAKDTASAAAALPSPAPPKPAAPAPDRPAPPPARRRPSAPPGRAPSATSDGSAPDPRRASLDGDSDSDAAPAPQGPKVIRAEPCPCAACGETLATAYLFGPAGAFARPHAMDVLCPRCPDPDGRAAAAASPDKDDGRRKRKRPRLGPGAAVECKLCNAVVGRGGVREELLAPDGGWVEPEFGVEAICAKCTENFRFCSNCGGGGSVRSGKWRPKELFQANRKNCSLPHVRIGKLANMRFVVYRLPVHNEASDLHHALLPRPAGCAHPTSPLEPTTHGEPIPVIPYAHMGSDDAVEALCEDLLEQSRHSYAAFIAEAGCMRDFPSLNTWDKVAERGRSCQREVELFLRGGFRTSGGPPVPRHHVIRRYLGVVFYPSSRGACAGLAGLPDPAPDYKIAGFLMYHWNVTAGHVFNGHISVLGQQGVSTRGMVPQLQNALMARVEADVAALPLAPPDLALAPPRHYWNLFRRREHRQETKMRSQIRHMQLVGLDVYAGEVGAREGDVRALLDDFVMEEGVREDMEVVACRWEARLRRF